MNSVEAAIRAGVSSGEQLHTPTGRGTFTVQRNDDRGVVLLLGVQEAVTRLTWVCLEGVPGFLRGRGWVDIGGRYDTTADPSTLDGYLKGCIKRATAGWVAVLLERAGVLELDRRRPARVRLIGSTDRVDAGAQDTLI